MLAVVSLNQQLHIIWFVVQCTLTKCQYISDEYVWNGTLHPSQVRLAKAAITEVLDQLRPNAVALVDAFDIPDR